MTRGQPAGLHVGLAGVGRIGSFHAETLASLDGISAVTVADANPHRASEVASRHGFRTAERLLDAGVDAVVIATPTDSHAELVVAAARAGVPAFCEKPVALELAALDVVVEEVERSGTLVQIGFQRRFDDGYRAARDAVHSGALGKLLVLRAATHDPAPPPEAYIATSGGIFRDLCIHDIDAIRFVTGQEVVEVYADGSVRETEWFGRHGDVDAAVAVLRLSDGTLAILSGTRRDPSGYDARLEVLGTEDRIEADIPTGVPRPQGFVERFGPAYRNELAAFADTVRGGTESLCPIGDARAALAVAVAADRSRATRRPVSVDEVTGADPSRVRESPHEVPTQ